MPPSGAFASRTDCLLTDSNFFIKIKVEVAAVKKTLFAVETGAAFGGIKFL